MIYNLTTIITKEGDWYIAKSVDLGVASQGKTIEEAQNNLKEAIGLYLEGNPQYLDFLSENGPSFISTLKINYA